MSDATLYHDGLSDGEIKAFVANEEKRQAALAAEQKRLDAEFNAKVDAAKLLVIQAATETKRREERRARIAASEAKKKKVTEMPTVTERADETTEKAEVPVRSEPASNVTALWPATKAIAFIDRARTAGYFPITILPHTLKDANAGKRPGRFDRGSWHGWANWETDAPMLSFDTLTDWDGQTNSVPNVGIACGTETGDGFFIGVDIDCEAPEIVDALAKLADGNIAIRKGRPERSGLVALVVDELGDHELFKCGGGSIQLLREGKQFVAAGVHPNTKQPYRWEDGDELPVNMPALAELPRVKMADLVHVLAENGFLPSSTSAGKPANGRKAELLVELRDSELVDTFDELFVDDGAPFPLAKLRQSNPAFYALYAKYADSVDDPESVSHNSNRFAVCKDFLRETWPEEFTIAHAGVFCEGWPGAGERVDKREAKGQWDDVRLCNAFSAAEAAIKREKAGEVKQHTSTKLQNGEAFGAVEDDESEEDNETDATEETEADKANESEAAKQAAKDAKKAAKDAEAQRKLMDRLAGSFEYLDDIVEAPIKHVDWAVKYVVARKTTYIIAGKWGTGKTAVMLDVSLSIAHGFSWRGRKVKQGVVIYCALENPEDVRRRVRAWQESAKENGMDVSNGAFVMYNKSLSLFNEEGHPTLDERDLIAICKLAEERYGLPVAMVVIDTISKAIAPGNDREDGAIFVKSMQRVADATGAAVAALHHPTKAGDPVRGDSAFQGDSDCIIELKMDSQGRGTIEAGSKFKIGDPSKVNFAYRLAGHKIGEDEDKEDIEVVLAINASTAPAMGAVTDTEDAVATDTYEDKLTGAFNALETCVETRACSTNQDLADVGVSSVAVLAQLNRDRKAAGLPELKSRSDIPKLLAKLVASAKITKTGENKHTRYFLAD